MKPIEDPGRLWHLYQSDHNHYDAYYLDTQGHGLIVALDKERLLQVVSERTGEHVSDYDDLIEKSIDLLRTYNNDLAFQHLMDRPGDYTQLAPVRLLHSLEHALIAQASEQVGLQIFGGKILLRDATIILFEQDEVGDGGLVQLTLATGFMKLLRGARQRLSVCGQGCDKGCPACNFIEDAQCRPFVAAEFARGKESVGVRWIPPNALLDRSLAFAFIDLPGT